MGKDEVGGYEGPQGKIAVRRPRRVGGPGATAEHAPGECWLGGMEDGEVAEKGSSGDRPEERGILPGSRRRKE